MPRTSSADGPPGLGRHRGEPQPPWVRWASPLGRGALVAIVAVVLLAGLVVGGAVLVTPGHDPAADEVTGSGGSTRGDGDRGHRDPGPTASSSRGETRSASPIDPTTSGTATPAPRPPRTASVTPTSAPATTPPGKHHGRPPKPAGHPAPGHGATDAPGRH